MVELYKFRSSEQRVLDEGNTEDVVEKIECGNGIKMYLKGHKYPVKGMPTAEALVAINVVKKILIWWVKTFAHPAMVPLVLFSLVGHKKTIENIITDIRLTLKPIVLPIFLKPEYRDPGILELEKLLSNFFNELGIDTLYFPEIVAHVFEYDSAYRFRLVDIMSETNVDKIVNSPWREISKLTKLLIQREGAYKEMKIKFKMLKLLLLVALLHPKIRRAFCRAAGQMDISKLQYDDADKYWALKRTDYNAFGKSFEERQKILKNF